jgi:hypothetical protein
VAVEPGQRRQRAALDLLDRDAQARGVQDELLQRVAALGRDEQAVGVASRDERFLNGAPSSDELLVLPERRDRWRRRFEPRPGWPRRVRPVVFPGPAVDPGPTWTGRDAGIARTAVVGSRRSVAVVGAIGGPRSRLLPTDIVALGARSIGSSVGSPAEALSMTLGGRPPASRLGPPGGPGRFGGRPRPPCPGPGPCRPRAPSGGRRSSRSRGGRSAMDRF